MRSPVPLFTSTRGGGEAVPFSAALLHGLAPDGGLYVPDRIPRLPDGWRDAASIGELGFGALRPWIGEELPDEALASLVRDALDFPAPLVPLGDAGPPWQEVYVLELFHGPTLSFKDFGARTMARLMSSFLERRRERMVVLVATSGDTGSAVADGFAGQEGIEVVLLYPRGKVSPVQERQLVVRRPGVRAYAVEGSFDDCQRMVKEAFADPALGALRLSSANSINVGRLLPQMVYYLWAAVQGGFESLSFVVPSGNLGNLTAGLLAGEMGLPVRRYVAAHNANDFFPRYLAGVPAEFRPSVLTCSNAMDVGAPSNFERLRAFLPGGRMTERVWATSVTDGETLARMRAVHQETGYTADPHTAVGLEAALRFRREQAAGGPLVVLATAHPAKFPETVARALGVEPPRASALERLVSLETRVSSLPPRLDALREALLQG